MCLGPSQSVTAESILRGMGCCSFVWPAHWSPGRHVNRYFLNGLRCLIAIRGSVRQIRCDRGTNFVCGESKLRKQYETMVSNSDVASYLLTKSCDFVFNSPHSSHMGRVWEQQIRSIRNILVAQLNRPITLDSNSLRTIMYEVMSLLNSRPLRIVQADTLEPLTPHSAHEIWNSHAATWKFWWPNCVF